MKCPNLKILFLLIFALCSFAFSQNTKGVGAPTVSNLPAKAKRFALIIGVDAYQKDISPLYGTVNDAKALRDVLIKYAGFSDENIILMTTDSNDPDLIPTRGNIIDQLDKLQRVVPENGLILFSFSGHGVSIGDDAFIVPSDGQIYQNADLMRERAIDVLRIKRAIQATKVKQVIMFLDACRNDPVKGKGDVDNNLTTAYAKGFSFETKNQSIEAYATLYATSFGDRAYEFLDKKTNKYRGYFSYAIEEGLNGSAASDKGEVTLAGLIRYIEDSVKERVRINLNERQIPYPTTEGFRNSDLVIAVVERNTPITTNSNQLTQRNGEQAFWQEIEKQNSISGYERYLSDHPNGDYNKVAKIRLGRLKWENFKPTALKTMGYKWIWVLDEGLAFTSKINYIDHKGNEVIASKYDRAGSFRNGLAPVRVGDWETGKWGFIDKFGKEVISTRFDDAWSFYNGLAKVKIIKNGVEKYGFINKSGVEIIPIIYEEARDFENNIAPVKLNGKWGVIDSNGNEIIPFKYENAWSFSEGLLAVKLFGKYGYIDKTGKVIISFEYDYADDFNEGLAAVVLGNKLGFIDKTGKEVIPFKFEQGARSVFSKFKEGLFPIKIDEKYGFINKSGELVIEPKYEYAYNFENGLAKVSYKDKYGWIDKTGREVIPIKYDKDYWFWDFWGDFIGVYLNGEKGFVDIYGNEYFDF